MQKENQRPLSVLNLIERVNHWKRDHLGYAPDKIQISYQEFVNLIRDREIVLRGLYDEYYRNGTLMGIEVKILYPTERPKDELFLDNFQKILPNIRF